jgi:hypothetical protein
MIEKWRGRRPKKREGRKREGEREERTKASRFLYLRAGRQMIAVRYERNFRSFNIFYPM